MKDSTESVVNSEYGRVDETGIWINLDKGNDIYITEHGETFKLKEWLVKLIDGEIRRLGW